MKKHSLWWKVRKDRGSKFERMLFFCLPLLLVLMLFGSVEALTITMTDVGPIPMSADKLSAFQQGAQMWEMKFLDPVTVNINISFEPLDEYILGSTSIARTTHSYTSVRAAMLADAFWSGESNVVNSLPLTSVTIEAMDKVGGENVVVVREDESVTLATANAKALGLSIGPSNPYPALPAGVDAEIRFATAYEYKFDFDPSNGIDGNKVDFVGVAAHEIGHALGFVSTTDAQDNNPTFTLHLSTLDLWRYEETGGVHNITTGIRHVTCGDAEYYDSSLNNVPMSHGVTCGVDPDCDTNTGKCQASHWSDDQGNLMDPSIADGVLVQMKSDDIHAMDFIGWSRGMYLDPHLIDKILVAWFPWPIPWPDPWEIPEFGGIFEDYPLTPPPDMFEFPDGAFGIRVGFDFGIEGMERRSGLGFATFNASSGNTTRMIEPLLPVRGQEYLDPPGPYLKIIPQNLSGVFIQSDIEGVPFTFESASGENGCPFDPTLGRYGGYRVPGFIDGKGDGVEGDVDAQVTLILLAPDESGEPMPEDYNVFESADGDSDTNIIIYDAKAIGAVAGPVCGDDEHPILRSDLDGNCIVDMRDLAIFAEEWMLCTAPEPGCP